MSLSPSDLWIFTARVNPLHWSRPHENYLRFADGMLKAGVNLVAVECVFGEEDHVCAIPGVKHIAVRAQTRGWTKENLINLGIQQTPQAKYVGWFDADIVFRRPDWALATLHALQHYNVVQPWKTAMDLGPKGELMQVHQSFCSQYHLGQKVIPDQAKLWKHDGGPYEYPHSGYAWAATRQALEWVGGLFEQGGMGSGDHHMALGLVGGAQLSMPGGTHPNYAAAVMQWQDRAVQHINGNIGYVDGVIEHLFHGRKSDRGYQDRWGAFVKHKFDPTTDLKRNTYGVLEFAQNKPELRRAFDRYLSSRNEDINSL